jgi:hypothetical protein
MPNSSPRSCRWRPKAAMPDGNVEAFGASEPDASRSSACLRAVVSHGGARVCCTARTSSRPVPRACSYERLMSAGAHAQASTKLPTRAPHVLQPERHERGGSLFKRRLRD